MIVDLINKDIKNPDIGLFSRTLLKNMKSVELIQKILYFYLLKLLTIKIIFLKRQEQTS